MNLVMFAYRDRVISKQSFRTRRVRRGVVTAGTSSSEFCGGAVNRAFDYLVPEEVADGVRVGTIVRVPLHGRRVRGWVVADGVEPEVDRSELRPLAKVASAGPPSEVVDLCRWVAWRYAGRLALLLRAASPPNAVRTLTDPEPDAAVYPPVALPEELDGGALGSPVLVAWPPAADRGELVRALVASEGSSIVVVPDAVGAAAVVADLRREGRHTILARGDRPDAERTARWDEARRGACVVVGGRVAVLAPVPDLQAIVVLDEGDEALKEERAPAWNAREVALERGRYEDFYARTRDWVLGRAAAPVDPADGVRVLEILEQARQSAGGRNEVVPHRVESS